MSLRRAAPGRRKRGCDRTGGCDGAPREGDNAPRRPTVSPAHPRDRDACRRMPRRRPGSEGAMDPASDPRGRLSRREVIARAAGLAASAALPPWIAGCGGGSWGPVASAGSAPPHDVIVIGAGAAGLACAHALLAAGVDVLVLEATTLRHGRVRSAFAVSP